MQRVPIVLEVNAVVKSWEMYDGLRLRRTALFIERHMFSRAEALMTVTGALKDFLEESGVRCKKIVVTHNAINPAKFIVRDSRRVRSKYALDDRIVFGFVGSLRQYHGVDVLLDGITKVHADRPACAFLIVGTGELYEQFRGDITARGLDDAVSFAGWVEHDDVPTTSRRWMWA